MASAKRLYRIGLALATLGSVVIVISFVVALRAFAWELPSSRQLLAACDEFLPGGAGLPGLAILALAALAGAVFVRGLLTLATQIRSQRRVMRRLGVQGVRELYGGEVVLVADHTPQAFCSGYLRPRVYLSTGALRALQEVELRAVLAHERHHCSRRDPLRLLLAAVLGDALFFLPAVRRSSERYKTLSELAADEAAVRELGDGRALASALLAFGEREAPGGVVAIAPERVDHLMGARPKWRLSSLTLIGSTALALGLAVTALLVASLPDTTTVSPALALGNGCMALMVVLPAAAAIWLGRAAAVPRRR